MRWIYDDGGRIAAGMCGHHALKNAPGDCVCRSIAIAADMDYLVVRDAIDALIEQSIDRAECPNAKMALGINSCDNGVSGYIYETLLETLGFEWTWGGFTGVSRVRDVGQTWDALAPRSWKGFDLGCSWPRLQPKPGRYIVRCVRHLCAVIDGDLHDIDDWRDRRAYGYWHQSKPIHPEIAELVS